MDFTRAWEIAKGVLPKDHNRNCSFSITNGGVLCDCEVLTKHPQYIKDYTKKIIEIEISEIQIKILQELHMDYEMCVGYGWLDHIADKKTLEKEIKFLKAIGFVETYHGLMDDDGMVAGSGFCRTEKANKLMDKYNL